MVHALCDAGAGHGRWCRFGMHVVGVAACSEQLANGVVDVAVYGQLRVHLCPQTQHARLV